MSDVLQPLLILYDAPSARNDKRKEKMGVSEKRLYVDPFKDVIYH